ncbi:MAG: DNA cytosine methyltransferase [Crenarchaeota archaeon]|nr:DNA cytosine methyltransferase [Thermoproteota archaeon]
MRKFLVVSLFSGAGGLDLGFLQAGAFKVIFANEVSESVALTYARNIGMMPVKGSGKIKAEPGTIAICDVAQVDFSGLKDLDIDVIVGGPPCQDFSAISGPEINNRGIKVGRGKLYKQFLRALLTLQPKVFVFENVPGLIRANKGSAYKTILKDFKNLNFRLNCIRGGVGLAGVTLSSVSSYSLVFSGVADFSALGVPQKRQRLIIIGVRKDLLRDPHLEVKLQSAVKNIISGCGRLFKKYPLTVMEVFEGKPLHELQEEYEETMKEWTGIWKEISTPKIIEWKKNVWDKLTFDAIRDYITANGINEYSEEELERVCREHEEILKELGYLGRKVSEIKPCDSTYEIPNETYIVIERMKRIPPGGNHEFVKNTRWHVEGKGISLIYRRLHPLKPSYTLVAYGGGGTYGYHYARNRSALSLREMARLQTFPDDFFFSGTKKEIRAQIGEAVPPLAGKRIAEIVKDILLNLQF